LIGSLPAIIVVVLTFIYLLDLIEFFVSPAIYGDNKFEAGFHLLVDESG